jgi:hypothetical protein
MTSKPCVCEGSNENCAHCFGRGYVDATYEKRDPHRTNRSGSDEQVNEFIAKHPSFNPNPLQQAAGSGARYRPHRMSGQHHESQHEEIGRHLAPSTPVNVRLAHLRAGTGRRPVLDVMKVAKEMAIPTCPLCHLEFPHLIELRAHMQTGCAKPKAPVPKIRYIPPELVGKSRDDKISKAPSKMIKCSFCGCQVKSTNLQKHLGRCPKGPRGYSNPSAKKPRHHAIDARTVSPPTLETNNSLPEPKRLKPRDGYEQVSGRDRRDATKLYAHPCRENGKYGSHPMHDGFDDESGPE